MEAQSINPYPLLGKMTSDGLDDLISKIGATGIPTFDDFNKVISSYVKTTLGFGTAKLTEIEMASIIPHAVNNYIDGKIETRSLD